MARTRAQAAAQGGLTSLARKGQGAKPQGIQSRQGASRRTEPNRRIRLSTIREIPSRQDPPTQQSRVQKRKQPTENTAEPGTPRERRRPKRQRISPIGPAGDTIGGLAVDSGAPEPTDPVAYWVEKRCWPDKLKTTEEALERDSTMDRLLARKKSSSNLPRKRSNSATSTTSSDQKSREEKSVQYRDPRYKTLLATKGSFMDESTLGITEESRRTYVSLLESDQTVPNNSLFRDDLFKQTCRKVEDRNEARIIRDITPLIVPPAEILATYGATQLECLIESTNEGWSNSRPLTGTRPQPDYSVGFRREAFTEDQLAKMRPIVGDFIAGEQSLFMATYYMYFPFLTCEVKCGAAALDIADRQNAHSMTLAVRAIVELFRAVKREGEVNREILAFSVSHDHRSVRIYGHYPVITGEDTKYYQHPIHEFSFTAMDGKDKWTAYRFTKNIYDTWMPKHFKNICSAIDQLPSDVDFDIPPLSEATGLSQGLGGLMSEAGSALGPVQQDRQGVTPDTSFTVPGKRVKQQ